MERIFTVSILILLDAFLLAVFDIVNKIYE